MVFGKAQATGRERGEREERGREGEKREEGERERREGGERGGRERGKIEINNPLIAVPTKTPVKSLKRPSWAGRRTKHPILCIIISFIFGHSVASKCCCSSHIS